MFSFKQLEAVYWITQSGSFESASRHLHTSQSAISKRVKELELALGSDIFDRNLRHARLTPKGEEVLQVAERLLKLRDIAVEQLTQPDSLARSLRIGVTELTAWTWLPELVRMVRGRYPKVSIEPIVDSSVALRAKLAADELDFIVVPDTLSETRVGRIKLGMVECAWMCKPGMLPTDRVIRVAELGGYTILTPGMQSGTFAIYDPWFKAQVMSMSNVINCNSVVALIGLAASGIGIGFMPLPFLEEPCRKGTLQMIKTVPPLPPIPYAALYKEDRQSSFVSSVIMLAQECCDFSLRT